tara:strand:+ start:386 stop:1411 length:1026 start_codon:yes stop_codon:yes gene_type:complete
MGLFSKIKKAFKKVTGAVKKVVKKVVKGVKKVVKKISSSKILKALAIAAAVVVTGGAALTAFGSTTGLAATKFGSWMMTTSANVLGGTAFGAGATGFKGALQGAGNFLAKTAAKPFGAVGGALGSTARVGANIVQGKAAFTAGSAAGAPVPFSGAALSGQMDTSRISYDGTNYVDNVTGEILTDMEVKKLPFSFTQNQDLLNEAMERNLNKFDGSSYKEIEPGVFEFRDANGEIIETVTNKPSTNFFDTTAGKVVSNVGSTVATNVLTGAAMQYIQGDPEQQGSMSGAAYEGSEFMDPLKVYAAQQGINTDNIYQHMMYGNADPSSMYGNELYRQQTFGVA